jgi:hypothetical protein
VHDVLISVSGTSVAHMTLALIATEHTASGDSSLERRKINLTLEIKPKTVFKNMLIVAALYTIFNSGLN